MLAVVAVAWGMAIAPAPAAGAVPGVCPPFCDAIPDSAWMSPASIPLNSVYRWPGLAGLAVTAPSPRFGFEALCQSPPAGRDPRHHVVAERSVVLQPPGQWNLLVQVLHWRGDVAHAGPVAMATLDAARARFDSCAATAPAASPSVTTSDRQRIAAVISVSGDQVMHEYLLADPDSATVVELAMWSSLPPAVEWPAVSDATVFAAMAAPLCSAYIGSCR
ncbi:ATPase [Mycobacterium sp. CPCC 205710]|uniref:ATPase n=2 Tax=Mycobacterium deserti TaxID=2978347 RepID=A0ABT2M609_9MYCO|nr:ATPase [Mycobacterium deserti]MCT7657693.1 ATPase [Mycobacterium deserti]